MRSAYRLLICTRSDEPGPRRACSCRRRWPTGRPPPSWSRSTRCCCWEAGTSTRRDTARIAIRRSPGSASSATSSSSPWSAPPSTQPSRSLRCAGASRSSTWRWAGPCTSISTAPPASSTAAPTIHGARTSSGWRKARWSPRPWAEPRWSAPPRTTRPSTGSAGACVRSVGPATTSSKPCSSRTDGSSACSGIRNGPPKGTLPSSDSSTRSSSGPGSGPPDDERDALDLLDDDGVPVGAVEHAGRVGRPSDPDPRARSEHTTRSDQALGPGDGSALPPPHPDHDLEHLERGQAEDHDDRPWQGKEEPGQGAADDEGHGSAVAVVQANHLVRERAARRFVRDALAHPLAEEGLAERRGDRHGSGPAGALFLRDGQQVALLVIVGVLEGAEGHQQTRHRGVCLGRPLDDLRMLQHALELADPRLNHALLVLGRVVLSVLADVTVLTGTEEPLGHGLPFRR